MLDAEIGEIKDKYKKKIKLMTLDFMWLLKNVIVCQYN